MREKREQKEKDGKESGDATQMIEHAQKKTNVCAATAATRARAE